MRDDLVVIGTLDPDKVNVLRVTSGKSAKIENLYARLYRRHPGYKFAVLIKPLNAEFETVSKEEFLANLKMNLAELEK